GRAGRGDTSRPLFLGLGGGGGGDFHRGSGEDPEGEGPLLQAGVDWRRDQIRGEGGVGGRPAPGGGDRRQEPKGRGRAQGNPDRGGDLELRSIPNTSARSTTRTATWPVWKECVNSHARLPAEVPLPRLVFRPRA